MSFRPATREDEGYFYACRLNDEAQGRRHGYWHGPATTQARHHDWYTARVESATTLLIWLDGTITAGCVRIDSNGEVSFQAAPSKQPRLLEELKTFTPRKLKFTVDQGDPKAAALEQAGFVESPVRFFTWRR